MFHIINYREFQLPAGFSRLFSLTVIEVLVAAERSLCGISEVGKKSGIDA